MPSWLHLNHNPLTLAGFALVFVSTCLLIPGLCANLLFYDFSLEIFGTNLKIIDSQRTFTWLLHQMWDEGAYLVTLMLTFFGLVIPTTKFVLFGFWVYSGAVGPQYLSLVRGLSKWTAADAVVEAIVVGMLLKVPNAYAHHGVGFACFVGYCILSSLAFLCLPGDIQHGETKPNALHENLARHFRSPRVRTTTLALTLISFLVLLCIGGSLHCLRMSIPREVMQAAVDKRLGSSNLPAPLRGLTEPALRRIEQGIGGMMEVQVDVSLSGCVRRLVYSGHFYTVCGSVLLFFCVILLPVMYAVINTARALSLAELPEEDLKEMLVARDDPNLANNDLPWWPAMDRVRAFSWDLSMIDVCAVALPLTSVAAASEKELQAEVLPGVYWLIGAALLWHIHNFCCRAAQVSILTYGLGAMEGEAQRDQGASDQSADDQDGANPRPPAIYI